MDIEQDDELLLTDVVEGDDPPEGDIDLDATADTDSDADEDDGLVISFGDEEAGAEQAESETPLIRDLRKELRLAKRELRQKRDNPAADDAPLDAGPKPVWGDGEAWDYDGDTFDAARDAWDEKNREVLKAKGARDAARQEQEREGQQLLSGFVERARKLPVKDFEAAHETIIEKLGEHRVSLIIAGAKEPEKLIYALSKAPTKLAAISSINNPVKFAFAAADLERELKVTTRRKAPDPDTPQKGDGSASGGDRKLDALEAEAARTGDRTKVVKYKRELRDRKAA